MQIKDLKAELKSKLAERTDIDNYPYWVRDSVLELTESISFNELETYGDRVIVTGGKAEYPAEFFTKPGDKATDNSVFCILVGSAAIRVEYREPAVVVPISYISGMPRFWTRHGNQIIFGPKPGQNYECFMLYQREHPFNNSSREALEQDTLYIPNSWREIIILASAERGAMELRLPDYVALYHTMLHGDPANPGSVGILKARKTQHERDKIKNGTQFRPYVGRY